MSKHFLIYILPLFLFDNNAFAQIVKGQVIDTSQAPITFATIAALNAVDSSLVKGNISDENGNFIIEGLSSGSYLIKVTALGFNTKYIYKIQVEAGSIIDLYSIALSSNITHLNEISISVIKKTIEFKNGNIIVNVDNSPLAKGNTVYDLFSKLPGVSIDNNIIQLNGKAGVIITLDGRIQQLTNSQLLNMLKSMNAELVEKIELLKNPPVKYDAAGSSGIINIKTKKTKIIGFSGSAYTSSSQGFYARSMLGISLNYKFSKIVLFSNLDNNHGYYQTNEQFNKKFSSNSFVTEFSGINLIKDKENNLNYKIGADWFIDRKNIIGFKIDGGPGYYNSKSHSTNTVLNYNNLGFDHLNAAVYTPDKWNINNYNINAAHSFDTVGTILNFTSDYTRLFENMKSNIQNIFLDVRDLEVLSPIIYGSNNINTTNIFASNLDFIKVISSKSSFEIGAKTSFITTSNNYVFERKDIVTGNYFSDTALTNNYIYVEQTYAAYFNYIRSFRKMNMQIGFRAENTNLKGRNTLKAFELKRNYYNLFPNIMLEYVGLKNNNLQFNLTRRIDRPQYDDLNPFRRYRDQYSYYEGNPFLLPHYSNTIEFTHNYQQQITNTLTYTRIDNVMLGYTKQNDSTLVTTQTTKNMRRNNYYAYSFFIQRSLKSWLELSANCIFSYIDYVGDVNDVVFKTASLYYTPSLTTTFTTPKNTKIEMIALYKSAKVYGLIHINPRWMFSLAFKKTFLNEKLDFSVGVNDIFYSFIGRTGVDFDNQKWDFMKTEDTRRLVVNINYNFGKVKIDRRETNSNEQEKERLNH